MRTLLRCTVWVVAVLFIGLTTQQNMSFGGEIEDLKRKLIYLETREMLESELELLQAEIKNKTLQIKKLESEYQDVITASQKEQTVSTETKTTAPSNEPETSSEPKAEPKVETSSTSVPDNQEWEYYELREGCDGWKPKKWEISSDTSFTFWGMNRKHNWKGKYTGNLLANEAEIHNTPQVRDKLKKFNAVQEGNDWAIKLRMEWPGGGCNIRFKLRVKQ